MYSIQTIVACFRNIITPLNTQSIIQSQKLLLSFEKENSFLSDLCSLLLEAQLEYPVKKLIVVYLEKYSKRVIKQRNNQKIQKSLESIIQLLSHSSIHISLKFLITKAFDTLINTQYSKQNRIKFIHQLSQQLQNVANSQNVVNNYEFYAFACLGALGPQSYDQYTKLLIKSTLQNILKLSKKLLILLTNSQSTTEQKLTVATILKYYSLLVKKYIKKLGFLDIEQTRLIYLYQLQQCVNMGLMLNMPNNQINTSLFIFIKDNSGLSLLLNQMKCNYISVVTSTLRLIQAYIKHPNLIKDNKIYMRMPEFINFFVSSASQILSINVYDNLPHNLGLLQTLDQLFNNFITSLRINDLYSVFQEKKIIMINQLVLPCLRYTQKQISDFYEDPQEFYHKTIQVINRQLIIGNQSQMNQQQIAGQIQQFQSLKTFAAQFLKTLCKYQDGTITFIFTQSLSIIQGKKQCLFPKSTFFIVILILKQCLSDRQDLKQKVSNLILNVLSTVPIPYQKQNNITNISDIDYACILLLASRNLLVLKDLKEKYIQATYNIFIQIIASPNCFQVHKLNSLQYFTELARIDEGQMYFYQIIATFNVVLSQREPSLHILEAYYNIIKLNFDLIYISPQTVMESLKLICLHIQNQVKKTQPTKIFLNKCWNIVRMIAEDKKLIPKLMSQLQSIIVPLVPYIDGIRDLDYQQDILLILTAFIQNGKMVTINQQKMFEIIPKIFYNQYCCHFSHAFHTIQLFIYYGQQIMKNYPIVINVIIDMAITSMTLKQYKQKSIDESQNCHGVMILQSLILKCSSFFTTQNWTNIITAINNKLKNKITFNFLRANVCALWALVVANTYNLYQQAQLQVTINKICHSVDVFNKVAYAPKIFIAALCELVVLYQIPSIFKRFSMILDLIITLLQMYSSRKQDNMFQEIQQQDQQKQYCNSLIMLKNDIKNMDQFNYFKMKIVILKQKNRPLLLNTIQKLPEAKRKFLNNILTLEKVDNVARKIFKIKK